MDIEELSKKAIGIKEKYHELEMKKYGKKWTTSQIMEGFVGDVGDLMKLIMAKDGGIREIDQVDEKIKHELADCLYCVLVLAKKFDIDIENEFLKTMDILDRKISNDN